MAEDGEDGEDGKGLERMTEDDRGLQRMERSEGLGVEKEY